MDYFPRDLQAAVEIALFKGKVIVVYGAHQVGKTTLLHAVQGNYPGKALYLDCNDQNVCKSLGNRSVDDLRLLVGDNKLVLIDEGQRVENIGSTLKQFGDYFPDVQVIATGSLMMFDLANDQNIPLIGGKIRFYLYPLSVSELLSRENNLENDLIYGTYPSVMGSIEPVAALQEIIEGCLYRDVFEHEIVRGGDRLIKVLQMLALRVGSEVSYNEIGDILGLDKVTVSRYVSLLEGANIIFHLPPLKRRLRKELGKLRKIYFYDLGVRNSLINNFNPLHLRQDAEALWENFFVSERMKYNRSRHRLVSSFFWRTYDGTRLDYLEEIGNQMTVFECQWVTKKWRVPSSFLRAYPGSELHQISRENYTDFL